MRLQSRKKKNRFYFGNVLDCYDSASSLSNLESLLQVLLNEKPKQLINHNDS